VLVSSFSGLALCFILVEETLRHHIDITKSIMYRRGLHLRLSSQMREKRKSTTH
jgi:hypothetical protein